MADKTKRRRRVNGEGSIYKRTSDGLWCASVTPPYGRRVTVASKSQNGAREKLKKVREKIAAGLPLTASEDPTLEKFLNQWVDVTLEQRFAAGRISESTLDSYRDNIERHVIPHLGRKKLSELKASDVRRWITELQKKPSGRQRKPTKEAPDPEPELLSARTVGYVYAILRKALNDARREELIARNVVELVEPPVSRKKEAVPPTKEEAAKLLAAVQGHRLGAYWLVVLALGLRRGEGLGLYWSDFDLSGGTVRLEGSIQRLRGEKDPETGRRKGRLVRKGTKTEASKATLAVPNRVVAALRLHKERQEVEKEEANRWVDDRLVFTTTIGSPLEPRNMNRAWHAVCDRAGVRRMRIHDLRHAAATYLHGSGADVKAIQAAMRHTRMQTTTDVYMHILAEVQRGTADRMDGVLGDITGRE